ncbi:MAG TPA: hypothetical protein VFN56_04385 [Candidatus Saccharimonadales bacterium]|nr:hypothetical protein [Candidatus Saccharimonadales bacterium]
MALFLCQSIWIALTAAYPMVFDENTHFGLIKLHAQQWLPVFIHQPAGGNFGGALTRDPSYLYHYILSFPYRILVHVTANQMIQIIGLRLINVAFFAAALVLFRKVLLKTGAPTAIVHVVLLFFVLLPVVPLLAGQINYDNLLLLFAAASLLLTMNLMERIRHQQLLPIGQTLILATVCLLGCLVQYEYLPIMAGIFLYVGWEIWSAVRQHRLALRHSVAVSWSRTAWWRRLAIGMPFGIVVALFIGAYGLNVVFYHNLVPTCNSVLSTQQCMANGPWYRNYTVGLAHVHGNPNPILFAGSWVYRMLVAMFYTSSGGASPQAFYLSINPLPVVFFGALALLLIGAALCVRYGRPLLARYHGLGFLLFIGVFFSVNVWLHNYIDYVNLGQKLAINGRYLFPVVPLFLLMIALSYREWVRRADVRMGLVIAAFLIFLQGGGILTYLVVSNQHWYWHNHVIQDTNRLAQGLATHIVIDKKPLASVHKIT